jgi:hypothetical protein
MTSLTESIPNVINVQDDNRRRRTERTEYDPDQCEEDQLTDNQETEITRNDSPNPNENKISSSFNFL